MDFKVKIRCKCGCEYELRQGSCKTDVPLCCPNCGLAVPSGIAENIRTGIALLGAVPEIIQEDSEMSYFEFSVESPEPCF